MLEILPIVILFGVIGFLGYLAYDATQIDV